MAEMRPTSLAAVPMPSDVHVGRRLRALRLERQLSLSALSKRAGMSVGALSQLERGLSSLRVKTLWALASALQIDPSRLISESAEDHNDLYCVRAGNRRALPVSAEGTEKLLLSPPGAALTGLLVTVAPDGGTREAYAHEGHEFGYVLEGEVELTVDDVAYRLKRGDSFAFRSTFLHAFRNRGMEPCTILWVNTARLPQEGAAVARP